MTSKSDKKDVKISEDYLKLAKRLPVENGKIILDRNNPDHVKWDEER